MTLPMSYGRVIAILPKSPRPLKGRFGSKRVQDWYKACVVAAVLLRRKEASGSVILVSSEVEIDGQPEILDYETALQELGVRKVDRLFLRHGFETVTHLEMAANFAWWVGKPLVIVCTWTHYPRVKYICFTNKITAEVEVAYGRPRPKEMVTDLLLTVLFPIIDLFHLRHRFLMKVEGWRQQGKF